VLGTLDPRVELTSLRGDNEKKVGKIFIAEVLLRKKGFETHCIKGCAANRRKNWRADNERERPLQEKTKEDRGGGGELG